MERLAFWALALAIALMLVVSLLLVRQLVRANVAPSPPVQCYYFSDLDQDGSGVIDQRDLEVVAAAIGTGAPKRDINRDGTVDVRDLAVLGAVFGETAYGNSG